MCSLNWRLAIPQFYCPGGRHDGRIQLLLPLRLSSARPADLALVIDRLDRCYKGCTILTVPMAYRNAWLITRPESDWLVVPPTPLTDRAELDEAAAPTWRRVSGGDRCPVCARRRTVPLSPTTGQPPVGGSGGEHYRSVEYQLWSGSRLALAPNVRTRDQPQSND